jgi:hypothetical protein
MPAVETSTGRWQRLRLVNTLFGTEPLVVHAHGHHRNQPHWSPIRDQFFALPEADLGPVSGLTVITCNNGAEAMGLLERGLDHLGMPYIVGGQGVSPWVNSRDKPQAISRVLERVSTPYVLYADSRDALVLSYPELAVWRFEREFDAGILFGADRMHWPPLSRFKRFERSLASGQPGDFHYLNGGMWIGRTDFCRTLFKRAASMSPVPEAPESEQGILRQLFLEHPDGIALDYRCQLFQNLGFVSAPIFSLDIVQCKES